MRAQDIVAISGLAGILRNEAPHVELQVTCNGRHWSIVVIGESDSWRAWIIDRDAQPDRMPPESGDQYSDRDVAIISALTYVLEYSGVEATNPDPDPVPCEAAMHVESA